MRDVVLDTNGEMVHRTMFFQFVEYRFDHRRGKLFGGKAVATADDARQGLAALNVLSKAFIDSGDDIQVERFAKSTRLFGPVKHGDASNGARESGDEMLDGERTEQA